MSDIVERLIKSLRSNVDRLDYEITARNDEIERLRALVEAAYREGYGYGFDGDGWADPGCSSENLAWRNSDAKKAIGDPTATAQGGEDE